MLENLSFWDKDDRSTATIGDLRELATAIAESRQADCCGDVPKNETESVAKSKPKRDK